MDPMFLPGVEHAERDGAYAQIIRHARAAGAEYPQIWHLFAFRPDVTVHLERFTHGVMRGESTLSAGFRELIAAYTSRRNHCPF